MAEQRTKGGRNPGSEMPAEDCGGIHPCEERGLTRSALRSSRYPEQSIDRLGSPCGGPRSATVFGTEGDERAAPEALELREGRRGEGVPGGIRLAEADSVEKYQNGAPGPGQRTSTPFGTAWPSSHATVDSIAAR